MSLYNMLHGYQPHAAMLCAMLDIDQPGGKYQSGRFRDCWLEPGGKVIVLHTRNGGGNRESYQSVIDSLGSHPCYMSDADDDFDSTYADFRFRVPIEYATLCERLAPEAAMPGMGERTEAACEAIRKMPTADEEKAARKKALESLVEIIREQAALDPAVGGDAQAAGV